MEIILGLFLVFLYISATIGMVVFSISLFNDGDYAISIFTFVCFLFLLSLGAFIVYDSIMTSKSEIIKTDVVAYVESFEYKEPYNQPIMVGKTMSFIHHEEQFLINLELENKEIITIESEEYYNNLKQNDKITIVKIDYVLKNGKTHKIEYNLSR